MGSEPGRLFDLSPVEEVVGGAAATVERPPGRVVRVVADVAAIRREFDYLVPAALEQRSPVPVTVGTMLRVPLHGRSVRAWVVAVDVDPPAGLALRSVAKISGFGPPREVIELCRWVAWRWSGRLAAMLSAASPSTMVRALPPGAHSSVAAPPTTVGLDPGAAVTSLRSAPSQEVSAAILELAAATGGHVLVVCPTVTSARSVAQGCRDGGLNMAVHPDGWARGAAGSSVVGTRSAVFAPVAGLSGIVVVDEHDETLQNEGSPTWHAREIAIERGRRAGVPVVLVSPTPTLEALDAAGSTVVVPSRSAERAGWATLSVVDRRTEDIARSGLYSEALVDALRGDGRAVCVLNRTGRAQMLGCVACGTIAACEHCDAALRQVDDAVLDCPQCGLQRPQICQSCSATRFRSIRIGVTKAREQLEALLREPVEEVTGATPSGRGLRTAPRARVLVGTEAVLQRVRSAAVVAFLEFDQELAAPRYRAAEEALALLARASTIVGGRSGRVLVQTRQPDHEVIAAATRADPDIVSRSERQRRQLLQLPPSATLVVIGGPGAPAYLDALRSAISPRAASAASAASAPSVLIDQRAEDQWLVRCTDSAYLLDVLAGIERPPGRLRLQVDPARLPR